MTVQHGQTYEHYPFLDKKQTFTDDNIKTSVYIWTIIDKKVMSYTIDNTISITYQCLL